MKKALLVTTVSGFVPQFEMNNVKLLQDMGYEIHYAANYNTPSFGNDNNRLNGTKIVQHHICFERSPFSKNNYIAYKQLMDLMNAIHFDLIHCHTPMGSVLTRIAAHKTSTSPIIYTAHGFHFYKGAPIINWIIYYPVEKYLSKYTDFLITINKEDYKRAEKKLHAKKTFYVPGVGVDTSKNQYINTTKVRAEKRRELGINDYQTVIICVGELIKRKNYESAIMSFAKAKIENACLLICGHGIQENKLRELVKHLNISANVYFLGFRSDIHELLFCADIFFFPSFQEGLSLALMEAMAAELPVICSNIRGNTDLIKKEQGGYLFSPKDISNFAKALSYLSQNTELRTKMGLYNKNYIQNFSIKDVEIKMKEIYSEISNSKGMRGKYVFDDCYTK